MRSSTRPVFRSADDAQLFADELMSFADYPYEWVLACYPWLESDGPLAGYDGPDEWQSDVLKTLGEQVRSGEMNIRMAVSSGHGIGKTALVAWIIHWYISTHPNPQLVATANTGTQLTNKTWRELAKWQGMARNGFMFQWTATSYRYIGQESTWFASATKWSAHNSEAFAGTHEEHTMMIFDEASGIDDIIWEVAGGAFQPQGGIWLAFGNNTKNAGRFYEITFGRMRKRWLTKIIDSRSAKMRNDELIQEWLEDWGEDSDYFRVRVRGLPPKQGPLQFISSEVVHAAVMRTINANETSQRLPLLMGFDVARQGNDASAVLMRHGRKLVAMRDGEHIKRFRERDITQLCLRVSMLIYENRPDMVFVDGTGIGAGAVDYLRALGHDNIIEVQGGSEPSDKKVFLNKRIEMWDRMRQWLDGADIPDDGQLITDLTTPEFGFQQKTQLMKLESKEDMKKRGASSPDAGDALAMTFYHIVPSKSDFANQSSYEPDEV
jgi:hypothetical protein